MHPPHLAALAQGSASVSDSSSVVSVVVTVVILLLLLVRRARGQELRTPRLIIVPLIVLLLGAGGVVPQLAGSKSAPIQLHGIDYLVLATDLALSVVLGSIRGFTVLIYPKNGTTWCRYGPVTVLLWFLSVALRAVLGIIGTHQGAVPLVTSGVVLLMFGLTLLIQNVIVAARASRRAESKSGSERGRGLTGTSVG